MDGTVSCRVLDANKFDSGSYRVIAKNLVGETSSQCKVTVIPADQKPTEPKFIIPLKATSAETGAKTEFRVKVKGVPKPTLQWYVTISAIDSYPKIKYFQR